MPQLFAQIIADQYKQTSEAYTNINDNKAVRKRTMKQIMNESFFHGANRFGNNFIA